ncbi:hypothetical protein KC19_11G015000 [Ceratodon purpureus]|uniref:Secreted protein n=1 Tax=Ceratodon purpureus TaxID=3225 RepID=A0A8T0GDP6_CERPU|nr:hypothetical protein KC19_11G015000 [Ceratodon purpureus]
MGRVIFLLLALSRFLFLLSHSFSSASDWAFCPIALRIISCVLEYITVLENIMSTPPSKIFSVANCTILQCHRLGCLHVYT